MNGSGTDEMLQITSIVVNIFEVSLHFYSVMTFLLGEATLLSWLKLDVAYQVGYSWGLYRDGKWTNSELWDMILVDQTTPVWLCWHHAADHQLSLSTQPWSWVHGAHECDISGEQPITSVIIDSTTYLCYIWSPCWYSFKMLYNNC